MWHWTETFIVEIKDKFFPLSIFLLKLAKFGRTKNNFLTHFKALELKKVYKTRQKCVFYKINKIKAKFSWAKIDFSIHKGKMSLKWKNCFGYLRMQHDGFRVVTSIKRRVFSTFHVEWNHRQCQILDKKISPFHSLFMLKTQPFCLWISSLQHKYLVEYAARLCKCLTVRCNGQTARSFVKNGENIDVKYLTLRSLLALSLCIYGHERPNSMVSTKSECLFLCFLFK